MTIMIINITDDIFTNIASAKNFLIDNQILDETKLCGACGDLTELKIGRRGIKETIYYRCKRKQCQKRYFLINTKLTLPKFILLTFLILADLNYEQLFILNGIADSTIARLKIKLDDIFERILSERPLLIGGFSHIVEIDETVLSRRGIIRNPTSFDEIRSDTVWILGCIDRNDEKNFWIKRIENRQSYTMIRSLDGVISVGSILYSDGHPSYPRVAEELGLYHRVVNHSVGFVAADGTNTNTIEGFWSHLKAKMRKENGVKRVNIDRWLIRYTFRRRYVMNATREEFASIFIKVLKYLFD